MTNHARLSAVSLVILMSLVPFCSARDRVIVVGDEELHFTPAPQRGYVVKLCAGSGDIKSLSGLPGLDMSQARPIRGLDRHGVWTVENEGPSTKNEQHIAKIKKQSDIAYVAPLYTSNGETVAIIPEIVIRVQPGIEMVAVRSLCEASGCTIRKPMEFTTQEYLLEVLGPDAEAVFTAVETLNHHPDIEWACPNTAFRPRLCGSPDARGHASGTPTQIAATADDPDTPGVFPNDEYFPMQWHLHNTGQSGGTPGADIRAPEAWEITTGDPNMVVAVLDTGVDMNHPDLVDNLLPGYDFEQDDDSPWPRLDEPIYAHGTGCAGLVAAGGNNALGVTGVTWSCKVMPARIDMSGFTPVSEADLATSLRWAASNGADVLTNSWGFYAPVPIIHAAIIDITELGGLGRDGKGCVVSFASGNDRGPLHWPAVYPEVVAVGATDHNDVRFRYSNHGPALDVVAPSGCADPRCAFAVDLWTTDISGSLGLSSDPYHATGDSDYVTVDGTSAACPIAAGVAALVLSVDPNLTSEQVGSILCRSAHDLGDPGWDEYHGWGRVDARAAVEMALHGMPLIYVDDDAPIDPSPNDPDVSDPNENGSAEHPFDSIQEAIDYALPGETIVLLKGTYTGPGNQDIDFAGKAITVRSQDGPERCVVDCLGQGRGFTFHSGEDPDAVLEGVTITAASVGRGAGIQINDSSPTIRECTFTGNSAAMAGGGITITGNSRPTIANCVFAANSAIMGAALNVEAPNVRISNCTLVANTAIIGGGGIAAMENTLPELTNCILWNNAPDQVFGEVTATFCNIEGGWEGEGNIDTDPLFADPANGDYRLKSQAGRWDPNSESWVVDDVTSRCIDAGDPDSDPSSEVWPHGRRINMGAYGGTPKASLSTEPTDLFLPRVACIHWYNDTLARSVQSFLQAHACPVTLIFSEDVLEHTLTDYDLIMIATDSPSPAIWSDDQTVNALVESGKPILGLGEGGYRFFGQLGLTIGYPNGAKMTANDLYAVDPGHPLYAGPYPVTVPADGVLQVYDGDTDCVVLYLWPAPPETVMALGRRVDDAGYYPLAAEQGHLLWGFAESPDETTETGRSLFLNAVIRTANAKLEDLSATVP